MSERNKDHLSREDWLKYQGSTGDDQPSDFSEDISADDWEAIALRGRSLLSDESEAEAMLEDIDEAIHARFGEEKPPVAISSQRTSFRWLSIAAGLLLALLTAWWLWPKAADGEQLYIAYFSHLENDLSVNLMGDNDSNELAESLRPYNARRYEEATLSIGSYLEDHTEPLALRLYYGISLLENGAVDEAIAQFRQLKESSIYSTYQEATDWYLALAYLKSNQMEAARPLLQALADTQHPYTASAKALLKAL